MDANLSGQTGGAEETSADGSFVFTQEQNHMVLGSEELGDVYE